VAAVGRLRVAALATLTLAALLFVGAAAVRESRAASTPGAGILYGAGRLCTHEHDLCSGIPRFNGAIHRVARIGSSPRSVTDGVHATDRAPVWSPDRRRIAFLRTVNTSGQVSQVWVMNADGTGQNPVTRGGAVSDGPFWSPDGKLLLFAGSYGPAGRASIYRVRPDGTGLLRLSKPPARAELDYPAWSPDGKRVAFSLMSVRGTGEGIFIVNVDGTGLRRLAPKSGSVPLWWPSWSPDGRTIAFVRNAQLWLMKADGNAQRRVGSGIRAASRPLWSPDGKRIAFTTYDRNDAARVLVVKPDGTGGRTSGTGVEGPGGPGAPLAWAPDGSRVAFVAHGRLTVMNRDGTGVERITPARTGYGILGIDW